MSPITATSALLAVARRVVWFKPPAQTLANPIHFLAHVMTYGTMDDIKTVQQIVNADAFREALTHAPAGVMDERSWAYWNLKLGLPRSPLPQRFPHALNA